MQNATERARGRCATATTTTGTVLAYNHHTAGLCRRSSPIRRCLRLSDTQSSNGHGLSAVLSERRSPTFILFDGAPILTIHTLAQLLRVSPNLTPVTSLKIAVALCLLQGFYTPVLELALLSHFTREDC